MDTFLWRNIYLSVTLLTLYDLLVSRRRRDNPSSIRQLKRILQHKSTLLQEELLHKNMVIPDEPPPAQQQHAQQQQRAGDSSNLPPPPSPAVKRRARPRLGLHGRCGPPGPLGAARAAARPSLAVKLPSLESVTSTKLLQPASAIAVCCAASARAGPRQIDQNVDIEAHIRRITSISVYVFERRYRRIVDIESLDIEVETSISKFLPYRDASISKYKTSISTNFQYRGTSIPSKFTNNDIDIRGFDIEVACRTTRYRRHKSKRRYQRFMMPISAYTDIGYKLENVDIDVMARFPGQVSDPCGCITEPDRAVRVPVTPAGGQLGREQQLRR